MVDKLLYFPYINLPQNEWCTRALLYWDNVGIVAPESLRHDRSPMRMHMRDLTDAGLVTPLHLDFRETELQRFASSFFGSLDYAGTRQRLRDHPERTLNIHVEKILYRLVEDLVQSGIATSSGLNVRFEEITGLRYLAGLAALLSNSAAPDFIPATDDGRCLRALTGDDAINGNDNFSFAMETEGFRTAILSKVLPAPAGGLTASELSRFKERHGDALSRFRKTVERTVLALAASGDRFLPQRVDAAGDEISEGVEEIRGMMLGAGWRRIGLRSFVSVFVPAGTAIGTIALGGHVAGAVAGASILPPLLDAFHKRRDVQEKIRRSPFAYAAIAETLFGPLTT